MRVRYLRLNEIQSNFYVWGMKKFRIKIPILCDCFRIQQSLIQIEQRTGQMYFDEEERINFNVIAMNQFDRMIDENIMSMGIISRKKKKSKKFSVSKEFPRTNFTRCSKNNQLKARVSVVYYCSFATSSPSMTPFLFIKEPSLIAQPMNNWKALAEGCIWFAKVILE